MFSPCENRCAIFKKTELKKKHETVIAWLDVKLNNEMSLHHKEAFEEEYGLFLDFLAIRVR
jgi:hypothetical protein